KVDISETAVNLLAFPGQPITHTLRLTAREKRAVYAHAVSDSPWLRVSNVQLEGRSAAIDLTVNLPSDPVGTLQAHVTVTSNGNQRFVVPVTLGIAGCRGAGAAMTQRVPTVSPVRTLAPGPVSTMRMTHEDAALRAQPRRPRGSCAWWTRGRRGCARRADPRPAGGRDRAPAA